MASLKAPFLKFFNITFVFGIPPSGNIHTLCPLSNLFEAFTKARYESLFFDLSTIIEQASQF